MQCKGLFETNIMELLVVQNVDGWVVANLRTP